MLIALLDHHIDQAQKSHRRFMQNSYSTGRLYIRCIGAGAFRFFVIATYPRNL